MLTLGFRRSTVDEGLFIQKMQDVKLHHRGVYVNDVIFITTKKEALIWEKKLRGGSISRSKLAVRSLTLECRSSGTREN